MKDGVLEGSQADWFSSILEASEVARLSYHPFLVTVELSRCSFFYPLHGLVMQIGRREERPRQGHKDSTPDCAAGRVPRSPEIQ